MWNIQYSYCEPNEHTFHFLEKNWQKWILNFRPIFRKFVMGHTKVPKFKTKFLIFLFQFTKRASEPIKIWRKKFVPMRYYWSGQKFSMIIGSSLGIYILILELFDITIFQHIYILKAIEGEGKNKERPLAIISHV